METAIEKYKQLKQKSYETEMSMQFACDDVLLLYGVRPVGGVRSGLDAAIADNLGERT